MYFADFSGRRLLSEVTRPDGALVTYNYDASGNLVTVAKPASNNSGSAVEGYNWGGGLLQIVSPRWSATGGSDGAYMNFTITSPAPGYPEVSKISWFGIMNPAPPDGTNTWVQPGVPNFVNYNVENVNSQPTYSGFSDSQGHQVVQYGGPRGLPTTREQYTGSQWLSTTEGWDANNNLTSATDARGNETDYAYDANGNTIADLAVLV
jgi:YD repeat-containing protein